MTPKPSNIISVDPASDEDYSTIILTTMNGDILDVIEDRMIIRNIMQSSYVGPKPPGIERLIKPNLYQDVTGNDTRNRHERRKAAKLTRGNK